MGNEMLNHITALIINAKAKNDEWAMCAIRDILQTLFNDYSLPSSLRWIGEEIEKEYKDDPWVYEKLELWKYDF